MINRINRPLAYLILLIMPFGLSWGLPGCVACGKSCEDQPFSESVRDYLLGFKSGSYWIYRNTQNGDIDSVYLVSETINSNLGSSPICRIESGSVVLKGFGGDRKLEYTITSTNNIISTAGTSDTGFYGDYNVNDSTPLTVAQRLFKQVVTLDHCCISGRASCYEPACSGNYFMFVRLSIAHDIGLIRWEAENYPLFGKVAYELIRYNVVR